GDKAPAIVLVAQEEGAHLDSEQVIAGKPVAGLNPTAGAGVLSQILRTEDDAGTWVSERAEIEPAGHRLCGRAERRGQQRRRRLPARPPEEVLALHVPRIARIALIAEKARIAGAAAPARGIEPRQPAAVAHQSEAEKSTAAAAVA